MTIHFFSNRSSCYGLLNQWDKALEDADSCTKVNPQFVKGYVRKGLAQFNLGQYEEAYESYEEGLKVDPENTELKTGRQSATGKMLESMQQGGGMGGFPGMGGMGGMPGGMGGMGGMPGGMGGMGGMPGGMGGMGGMPGGMGGMGGMPGGMGGMGGMPGGMGGKPDEKEGGNMQQQILMKLLSNPETAAYFQDPDFMAKFGEIQKNPANLQKHMNDPKIMKAFQVITEGSGMFNAGDSKMNEEEPFFKAETKKEEPKEVKEVKEAVAEKDLGNAEYKKKNYDAAVVHYNKAIELDPKMLIFRSNLCACLIAMKEYEKVFEIVDEGKRIFCTLDFADRNAVHLAKLIGRKGRAYWLQGDLDEAIKVYGDALMEASDNQLTMDLKEVKKIKIDTEKKAYLNPELCDEHREKGNALFKNGKYVDAIAEFEEALKRNPKDHKTYSNKASAYIKIMEWGLAMAAAEKAIELEPKYAKAHIRKAAVHRFLKEFHKALDCYELVLKMEPDNAEAKDMQYKTQMDIKVGMHDQGNDEERLKRAMQDPEIQMIMMDPMVKIALGQMQSNPREAQSYFTDPTLGPKLQKLIQAGVLKVA